MGEMMSPRDNGLSNRRLAYAALLVALSWGAVAAASADDVPLIVTAARTQDADAVRTLLADGVDVNIRQADGATALHWAAYRDDLELTTILLEAGADVDAVNDLGATPLWLSADNGSAAMVKRLVDAGADPNVTLHEGETPVMTAARTGNADAVRHLIAHGANVNATEHSRNQTALMWAAAQGHHETIEVLLEHGANVASRSRVRPRLMHSDSTNASQYDQGIIWNRGGYTPLLFAARHGDVASGRLLVAGGADINDAAPTGASVLVVATHSGHSAFARFALDTGADPNDMGAGYAPLHAAVLRGDVDLIRVLLARGADPNIRFENSTPLRRASQDWYLAPQLISATPYWLAAYYQEPDIMRALAGGGADTTLNTLEEWNYVFERAGGVGPPHIVGGFQTALQAAVRGRHDRGRGLLSSEQRDPDAEERHALHAAQVALELGADVNHADHRGNVAMHTAAQRNHETIVKFLAEHGANLDIENDRGQTPLALAQRAEEGRLARPDITRYPSGNSAQALRDLGASDHSEDEKAADEWPQ